MATNNNMRTGRESNSDADLRRAKGKGDRLWDRVIDDVMSNYPTNPYDGLEVISDAPITITSARTLGIDEAFYEEFEDDIIGLLYDYISGNSGGYLGWYPAVECDSMTEFLDSFHIKGWDDEDPLALYSNNRIILATFAYTETAYAIYYGFFDTQHS